MKPVFNIVISKQDIVKNLQITKILVRQITWYYTRFPFPQISRIWSSLRGTNNWCTKIQDINIIVKYKVWGGGNYAEYGGWGSFGKKKNITSGKLKKKKRRIVFYTYVKEDFKAKGVNQISGGSHGVKSISIDVIGKVDGMDFESMDMSFKKKSMCKKDTVKETISSQGKRKLVTRDDVSVKSFFKSMDTCDLEKNKETTISAKEVGEGGKKYKKWRFELGFQDQNFSYPKHSKM